MRKLLLILAVESAMAIVCLSQQIPLDLLGRLTRWDGTHKVLFFGAGAISTKERPIRAYANGIQRGSDIEIYKDFPDVKQVIVDDISAGPNGSTVIAGVLQFGSGNNRDVILTYDSSGALRSTWDAKQYSNVALVADDNSSVFALGSPSDEDEPNARYPLLTRYTPDGGVADQGLSSTNFREGSDAIDDNDLMAHPILMLWQDKLLVFAPTANEVLVCTLSGAIVTRTSLREVLLAIARTDKVAQASIHELMFADETHVILNLIERTTEELENEKINVMDERLRPRRSYRLDLKTMHFEQISGLTDGKRIMGVVGDQLLLLAPSGLGFVLETQ